MMKAKSLRAWVCIISLGFVLSVQAAVQVPALFSDNMVLQQGAPVPIWGWADDGDEITVPYESDADCERKLSASYGTKIAA
jgi:sialate O-acetylesterase